ncbi:MAG TPA: radical SAM protein [Acidimicrobiales bacterium]|nr:radical SAM protein [Acidimicrobiales bacterium]
MAKVKLVSLEDGITSCGFRKIAAYISRINPDTEAYYVSTNQYRSLIGSIKGSFGGKGDLSDDDVDGIAQGLTGADVVGFSSMTGYADLTRKIMARLRQLDKHAYVIWGGIHPIIHPEDAITADVDAICTGEGEFAFEEFFDLYQRGQPFTGIQNFWFRQGHHIVRNGFKPLMTPDEMDDLPFPHYGKDEKIYKSGKGFVPMGLSDYLANDGLGYATLWSIGCPFHCTFCGNTKFIANDPAYKKIRHPSAQYIVDEIKNVRKRFPHVSQVSFHDDSFMAITYRELETFAELWKSELGIPFAVYGVIPNYVKKDKFEILTWAGMNRVRMGIQSGSQNILDFYRRPTPPHRILEAGEVIAPFAPKYHIPPAYDIIMDNPVETRQDVIDTLELLYKMPRPYTLYTYSLKVIPNTEMEKEMKARGIDLDEISANYSVIPPRMANLLLYVLALGRPPRKLFDRLLKRVEASATKQKEYPKVGMALRSLYIGKRAAEHLRFMDFSIIPGWGGYIAWRLGFVNLWQRKVVGHYPRPDPSARRKPDNAARIPLTVDNDAVAS